MGAFHAYDIRGIYNVDFDKETAYKVGFFLPELLSADKVLVGRDARVSSDEIHEYLLKGLTDAGADVYETLEEKAANLLYFVTKNHSFLDGNKRIAATMFLYFLDKNQALFVEGKKKIEDATLVALTIMVAESRPEEKEMMITVIMNCLK